jgi:hypothetical protein
MSGRALTTKLYSTMLFIEPMMFFFGPAMTAHGSGPEKHEILKSFFFQVVLDFNRVA